MVRQDGCGRPRGLLQQLECVHHGVWQQGRILQGCQFDQADPVGEGAADVACHAQR
jgi:hypothetical protein